MEGNLTTEYPVPPDYALSLAETTLDALVRWLEAARVPPEVLALLRHGQALWAYWHVTRDGEPVEAGELIGAETTAMQAVNALAALGAVFPSGYSNGQHGYNDHAALWRKCVAADEHAGLPAGIRARLAAVGGDPGQARQGGGPEDLTLTPGQRRHLWRDASD